MQVVHAAVMFFCALYSNLVVPNVYPFPSFVTDFLETWNNNFTRFS